MCKNFVVLLSFFHSVSKTACDVAVSLATIPWMLQLVVRMQELDIQLALASVGRLQHASRDCTAPTLDKVLEH